MASNILLRAVSSTPAKIIQDEEEEKDILCKSSESEATSTDGNDLKNSSDNATATMMIIGCTLHPVTMIQATTTAAAITKTQHITSPNRK